MTPPPNRVLPGMLEMLILRCLTIEPMHGYGIAQHVQRSSRESLTVEEGSLYPALQRMRQKGWVKAEWGITANHQRARYYHVTPAGRRELGEQQAGFEDMIAAVRRVMRKA
jgi:PadR family transcriptional regulator, regulatory protein PadR